MILRGIAGGTASACWVFSAPPAIPPIMPAMPIEPDASVGEVRERAGAAAAGALRPGAGVETVSFISAISSPQPTRASSAAVLTTPRIGRRTWKQGQPREDSLRIVPPPSIHFPTPDVRRPPRENERAAPSLDARRDDPGAPVCRP